MAILQEKNKDKWTKDGRCWYFKNYYDDIYGNKKQYKSKLFKSKQDAKEEERKWLNNHDYSQSIKDMKFKDLCNFYLEHQKSRVKNTTFENYPYKMKYLEPLYNVHVSKLNQSHYENWRESIHKLKIIPNSKNDIQKLFKAILNYGTKQYNLNFSNLYNCMTPFKDSNDEDSTREMDFYTIEEFNYFIRNVPDLLYKCLFKTLFYCGLRNGEMRGIRWSRIDWKEKKIKILSQIPTKYSSRKFKETTLKTRTSKRILPIANDLYDDLKKLYEETKQKYSNFDDEWFVFGDILPMVADNPHLYQERVCKNIKLRVIRIHDFRHSCASFLINNGADIITVGKYLGHSKIDETLNTYGHMYKDKLTSIVNMTNTISYDNPNNANNENLEKVLSNLLDVLKAEKK